MNLNASAHLAWAHPLVHDWFINKFTSPSAPQEQGWPSILANQTTLISAPTGSGKTLAAFLVCIDQLVRQSITGELLDETSVLYVSPLKALTNDVQKNLLQPLQEIHSLGEEWGFFMKDIRVAVRTGDTLAGERQTMLKKPPHILVTTPESLYLLLTAEKSRRILQSVRTVIVDEIHALANNKRGTHLALSLERLQALVHKPITRIGLSATQKPIELVAQFLAGSQRPLPNIINIGHTRPLHINIELTGRTLTSIASNELWDEIYDRLAELARENRSTLIFVNTRKLAERVAYHLGERLGKEQAAAHHGSLSRKLRLQVETKLKQGELKALVATASLELGIDIGSIDLVCLLGSTRAISIALQRIGRAGHWHGGISEGKIFPTTCNELLECASLVHAIQEGDLDKLIIPEEPLDILAQQIVAACAAEDFKEEDLFHLVQGAFPYRHLSRKTFAALVEMLAEGIAGSRGRYGSYLFRDQVNGLVKGRRGSRFTAITSGGAIPENGLFNVIVEPNEVMIGTLDEDFAVESTRGDIFLLGNTSWQIKRVESAKGRILVEDAHGAPPTVPFWRGEAPARTDELSLQVARLRKTIYDLLPNHLTCEHLNHPDAQPALSWLTKQCGVNSFGAEQIVQYILQGRAVLGAVPTQETIIAERFFDEAGGMQLIIHAPFGARINKAWGFALRKRFCRSFNFELQAAATDDGINISLAEQHSFPLADVFHFLHSNSVADVLTQAVLQSPLFTTRWRWDTTRALALVRFRGGKKVPPNIQRMQADDLLAAVFPDAAACQDNLGGRDVELPSHPLIEETMKDALTEALDLQGLIQVLKNIENGSIQCIAVDTPVPSVFSHEILNANPYAFLDDAPLEERRARAVELRRVLPESILQEAGKLDADVISEVQKQTWPDIRNADELHDVLQTVIALPVHTAFSAQQKVMQEWFTFFDELKTAHRVVEATCHDKTFWVAAEKTKIFQVIYPETVFILPPIKIQQKELEREEALICMLKNWMHYLGPVRADHLAATLDLPPKEVQQILIQLEATGLILRGHFSTSPREAIEWCERRLLARIHQLTLHKLRKEIEPVTSQQFFQWLLTWQHIAPGTQLKGEQGLLEVIKQLQGFEIPANAWEKQIFASRIHGYQKEYLDRLCFTGVIGWGRLSMHPAMTALEEDTLKKRIQPTSVVPITFFIRQESDWMQGISALDKRNMHVLSHVAQQIYAYLQESGASFFIDIVQDLGHLRAEIETGLWQLVAAGMITADGFDNLRSLIDPHKRLGKRRRAPETMGRWSLLNIKKSADHERRLEAICWVLLKRYGIVFRELLTREKIIPSWRELLTAFRKLEDRGEIRGGRFVNGFVGEQFALPYAVESIRTISKSGKRQNQATSNLILSASDPLNLAGIILPGERITAISSKKMIFQDGNLLIK
ncbi:DEAD/DEAH box helicase [Legionella septentrionalis]|uniref:DEAD/DEAH box helicase n=1 Tax=Legionella septentrionalis TaxID=2498109 RepID=UPI000F8D0ECB|nr:DEAD/DEAH box helicase [Legionella septentrionalis]RUR09474.1 DEAD/DEAH box helicase [Legionella septentrionalis]